MRAVCFREGHGPAGLVDALEAIDAEVMDVRHCLYRDDPRVLGARLEKIGQLAAAALTTVNRVEAECKVQNAKCKMRTEPIEQAVDEIDRAWQDGTDAIDRAWQDANETGGQ